MKPIDTLIVDDHPLLRRGIRELLELESGIGEVREAGSGEEALQQVSVRKPDVLLLDLNMRGMDGLETLQAVRESGSSPKVIVFTVSDDQKDLQSALEAGADGYVLKDCEPEFLIKAVRKVVEGEMVVSETLTGLLAKALRKRRTGEENPAANLTTREREIVRYIAQGNSNKMIGRQLGITEGTVKVHVKNLMKKLNLRSRVEVAVWALEKAPRQ